ncbi:hypothetical protein R1A27_16455 [Methylobacterium sp. NMS12]|uniref:hypothetical protein n=1 Tax=Methylobacterium sp. NMS12 TaxID=3079766 RepID=UPI003F880338
MIIDDATGTLRAGEHVTVFSLPEAVVRLGKRYQPSDELWLPGDLFVQDCEIEIPIKEKNAAREIPIAYSIEGVGASTLKARLRAGFETKAIPYRASGSSAQSAAATG